MSQQDNPQDSQESLSAPPADSWATPPASNRPAEGATRVASLHHAEQTWNAGEGATDFLGLEQDSALGAPAPAQTADEAGTPEVSPTQAWLFHMENEARARAEPQAAEGASPESVESSTSAVAEWSAESLQTEENAAPSVLDALGTEALNATDPLTSLEAQPELEGELQPLSAEPKRSRKIQWLVAAGLVATLLGAGGWQIWNTRSKTHSPSPSPSDPLVWRSANTKSPKPRPTKTGVKPAGETPSVAQQPPAVQPPERRPQETPTQPLTTPTEVAQSNPPVEPPPLAPPDGQPTALATTPAPGEPVAQSNPPADPAPAIDFTPIAFSDPRSSDAASTLATPKGSRRPEASEVAGFWTSQTIPFDAIGADSLLRTPTVGAVRVLLRNGEHLQGRLHSVGQGHVSLDIALGRMSVDYSDVSEIVQILDADLTKKPSNGLPEETAGLLYVSAKVPGGYLTGWLVQRTEGKLTLITEQAKKITVEDDGFEPVSKGKARVIGTLGGGTAEAGSPAPQPDNSIPKLQSSSPAPKAPAKAGPGKPNAGKPKG